jgi:diguanylate cyclase (GGDEF)-like protein
MNLADAPSIRSRLIWLVMACIVPASLMVVKMISADYELARAAFIRSAMTTAHANAMAVDKEFAVIESTLKALATSPGLAGDDLRPFYEQARAICASQNIFNILLEDGSGQQLINTFRPYGTALPSTGLGPALTYMRNNDATAISQVYMGPISKRYVVSVGIPVTRQPLGFHALSAVVMVERFGAILAQQQYPDNWITSILDNKGTVVARTSDMKRFVGQNSIPEVLERLRELPEGAFETRTPDGKPILAVLAKATNSQWTVAIGIPLEVLNAELFNKLWVLVLATVVLLGGGLLFAWQIGDRISKSIRGLVAPALALGAGDSIEPATYGLREANEVGQALVNASRMHARARHEATHDPLTGLANRAMFTEFLSHQLSLAQRNQESMAVLYLDLDNFKFINDTHGHGAGDELLKAAAGRLRAELRKSDMAARLGGDEFAVVLVSSDEVDAAGVVEKLGECLAQPYLIGGQALLAEASIGVAVYPQSGASTDQLIACADDAMYQCKAARKKARATSTS